MDMKAVGNQIASLRRQKELTQSELGERLGVSFQAVSKWERGETLPDTAILLDLANALETSVDHILAGGRVAMTYKGKITVSQMAEGLCALKRMGELLGGNNMLYRCAVEGINKKMNTDIGNAFKDEDMFECFVAEAVIQNLMAGQYIDVTDVKKSFRSERFRSIVLSYCEKYGIK